MSYSEDVDDVIYEEVLYLFAMTIVAIPFLGLLIYQGKRLFCGSDCCRTKIEPQQKAGSSPGFKNQSPTITKI